MNKPPFLLPSELLQSLAQGLPPPPRWLRDELQNRLLLLLNHVLMQEPQAMARLKRQQGKTMRAAWGQVELLLQATPAGLLALAEAGPEPDLQLTVQESSPLSALQALATGGKPAVDIKGDVQLAAEVGWLVSNLRWDIEEDLARLMGDAAAHTLVAQARAVVAALRGFLVRRSPDAGDAAKAAP
ncbi:MAG TPA: hypothetical protein VFY31_00655 [Macromonas sp.]|nr:hypothetical protein [Macromonas sp.]